MNRPLLDANGHPIRPLNLKSQARATPIFSYVVEDCTILFISCPFQRPQLCVLGTNKEDIRLLCGIDAAIPFTGWTQFPTPGFYVYSFTFKSTEKPSLLTKEGPDMMFDAKEVRRATPEDFATNDFPLPEAKHPILDVHESPDSA